MDFNCSFMAMVQCWSLRGGVQPKFFVLLDFEIWVRQKSRTHDETFEGVTVPEHPHGAPGWAWPIMGQKYRIF